jgi:hypothetical protein
MNTTDLARGAEKDVLGFCLRMILEVYLNIKKTGFPFVDSGFWALGTWGSGHAKYLIVCKKSSKNDRFLVLTIPFWVQNNRSKDFKDRQV